MDSPYLFKFRMRCNSARCAQSASWFKTLPSSSSFLKLTLNKVPLKFQMKNCSHVKFKDFGHNTIFICLYWTFDWIPLLSQPHERLKHHFTQLTQLCCAVQYNPILWYADAWMFGSAVLSDMNLVLPLPNDKGKQNWILPLLISMLELNSSVRLEEVLWLFWVLSRCTDFWHFLI